METKLWDECWTVSTEHSMGLSSNPISMNNYLLMPITGNEGELDISLYLTHRHISDRPLVETTSIYFLVKKSAQKHLYEDYFI